MNLNKKPLSRFSKRHCFAVTLGDPGGVGPEVSLKALLQLPPHVRSHFFLVGDTRFFQQQSRSLKLNCDFQQLAGIQLNLKQTNAIQILHVPMPYQRFQRGKITAINGQAAFQSLSIAAALAQKKMIGGLVTAPLSKEAVAKKEKGFIGHTEYLAKLTHAKRYAMLLCGGPLRVVLVTIHVPLEKVSRLISKAKIKEKIMLTHDFLKKSLHIKRPKIGVSGLNPHAGENGLLGKQDAQLIAPVVRELKKKRWQVEGPLSPDRIFYDAYHQKFDAVVSMYHDHGLAPLKMISFDSGINVTLGLPFIRTSPDHGTAMDIAGKNKANSESMRQALIAALQYATS